MKRDCEMTKTRVRRTKNAAIFTEECDERRIKVRVRRTNKSFI